jgi:hypothetical protein
MFLDGYESGLIKKSIQSNIFTFESPVRQPS